MKSPEEIQKEEERKALEKYPQRWHEKQKDGIDYSDQELKRQIFIEGFTEGQSDKEKYALDKVEEYKRQLEEKDKEINKLKFIIDKYWEDIANDI